MARGAAPSVRPRRSSTARPGPTWTAPRRTPSRRARSTPHGAGNLARAAAAAGVPLLHLSTDYVFAGEAPRDARGRAARLPRVRPDRARARSTARPSSRASARCSPPRPRHTVVRTAWLFGIGGRNFVETMLGLARRARRGAGGRRPGRLPDLDGAPRAGAARPARARGQRARAPGGHRVRSRGTASRARSSARPSVDCAVEAATSEQMARPAPRPAWSALESERDDVLPMPPWQDGLAGYLAARAGMMRA